MSSSPRPVDRLEAAIAPLREELLAHPLYDAITSVAELRVFMQQHVFAVWDFMSLLKRLQRHAAGCDLPWVPPADVSVARFINEIVLGEECDLDGSGSYLSHFELYLNAMSNIDADRTEIDRLIDGLRQGDDFDAAWSRIQKPASTAAFVQTTINLALDGEVHEVAASFCYGREEVIPDMFSRLVPTIKAGGMPVDDFVYYLERHIELDGDEHGALARRLVEALIGDSEEKLQQAIAAATRAIEARVELWNGILAEIAKLKISPRFSQDSVSRETA
ncbi:MAG: antimetabolite toxin biosynthesis protein MgoB [Planctomyces sp.]|nr:antimetabolite toxin biosynthesis protein MgoB [Planctomyces sp.]